MYGADLALPDVLRVLECEAQHTLRCGAGDELDALDHAVHDHVLDARVLTLCVLADEHGVDVVVGGLVAGDGFAGADVGEEVEGSAEGKIEGYVAFADWGLIDGAIRARNRLWVPREACFLTARGPLRAIKFFLTLSMAASGITVRPSFSSGVTSTGSHSIGAWDGQCQPLRKLKSCRESACLGCSEDFLDRFRYFRPNAVAFYERNSIVALKRMRSVETL